MSMYLSDSLASPSYDDGLTNLRTDERRFECWINISIALSSGLDAFEELVSVSGHASYGLSDKLLTAFARFYTSWVTGALSEQWLIMLQCQK